MNNYNRCCCIQDRWKSKLKYRITKYFQLKPVITLFLLLNSMSTIFEYVRTGFLQLKTQAPRKSLKKPILKLSRNFDKNFLISWMFTYFKHFQNKFVVEQLWGDASNVFPLCCISCSTKLPVRIHHNVQTAGPWFGNL